MDQANTSRTVIRGTGIVSSLTLLSRLLGLVREIVFARLFGAGLTTDAFFVAFRIPNVLRSLLAEGALTSAFVPVFAEELRAGEDRARQALRSVVTLLLILTTALSLAGMIFTPELIGVVAPGFGPGTPKSALCITLTRIMLPYIAFISVVAILNGALNTIRIFGAAPLAQVVMNLVLTVAALLAGFFSERTAVLFMAWSVIVGGALEIVVQVPALRRARFSLRPTRLLWTGPVRRVLRLMGPAALGAAIYEITILVNTVLASALEDGSVSWLAYADRLAQLPIGVFTVALSSVLLPMLASAAAGNDEAGFERNLTNALRYTSFFITPLAAGLFFYAAPLVELLYQRGAFTPAATVKTAWAVQAMCFGLWGTSCYSMLVRAFIARKDTWTPALAGVFTLIIGTGLSLLLMGKPQTSAASLIVSGITVLQEGLHAVLPHYRLGHVGLALSSGLATTFTFGLLAGIISRRQPELSWRLFLASTLRSWTAALGMGTALFFWHRLVPLKLPGLLAGIVLGMTVYFSLAVLLRTVEAQETLALVRRYISRRRAGGR